MRGALVVAIVLVALSFLALTASILLGKAWRELRDKRRRRRRRALEPLVLDYAHGGQVSILAALGGGVTAGDEPVVQAILLDHVQRVRGVERDRLRRAFDELGLVDRYVVGLSSPRWWRRAEAAEHLGLAGAARAAPRLAAALEDDVPEVRLRAAKALGAV
ncbi:MAG TPA: HEAT repeat domain-containing protein, partial [Candidatus Polarisedimenticolaceae bacterium]|nr:HEAT repeat domain-containing protein [Candidatus Polarisedimenticolaceae bacterium]